MNNKDTWRTRGICPLTEGRWKQMPSVKKWDKIVLYIDQESPVELSELRLQFGLRTTQTEIIVEELFRHDIVDLEGDLEGGESPKLRAKGE